MRDRRLAVREATSGAAGHVSWADQQPSRPSLREATAWVLRDAVECCREAGRSAEWAKRRIGSRAGVSSGVVGGWMRRGVPKRYRTEVLYDACQETVHEARLREARLGEGLRQIREKLGLTQKEMAHKVGVHASTLQTWETRQSQPCARNLERLDKTVKRLVKARG